MNISELQKFVKGMYPGLLGIELLEASQKMVRAMLPIQDRMANNPGVIHGGVLMSFADTLGAIGAFVNLPEGCSTTTLESKTNFLRPAKPGETLLGKSVPLHLGRQTMVWQTEITNEVGKTVALVTQTQMVLQPK